MKGAGPEASNPHEDAGRNPGVQVGPVQGAPVTAERDASLVKPRARYTKAHELAMQHLLEAGGSNSEQMRLLLWHGMAYWAAAAPARSRPVCMERAATRRFLNQS
jgi:hypothetical protein